MDINEKDLDLSNNEAKENECCTCGEDHDDI